MNDNLEKEINQMFQNLSEDFEKIKMLPSEKHAMLHNILSPQKSFWNQSFVFVKHHYFVNTLVLLFVLTGSLSYFAEDSVPGDTLYNMKVGFTEPLRGISKITPEEKAVWEEEKVIRRLDEVNTLLLEKKINNDVVENVTKRFDLHKEAFNSALQKVSTTSEAYNISTKFKDRVKQYKLSEIKKEDTENKEQDIAENNLEQNIPDENKKSNSKKIDKKQKIRKKKVNFEEQQRLVKEFVEKVKNEVDKD